MSSYTIKYIINLGPNERNALTKEQLRRINHQARIYARERWNKFQKAYKERVKQYGTFPKPNAYRTDSILFKILERNSDYSKMDISDLRHELAELRKFLKSKTSTMAGWERTLKKFVRNYNKKANETKNGPEIKKEDYDIFWQVFNRVDEFIHTETLSEKYELWREVAEYISQHRGEPISIEDWANEIIEKIELQTMEGKYNNNGDIDNPYVYNGNKKL